MTLSKKFNIAIILITGLLLALYMSGVSTKNSMKQSLEFVTGPAWNTSDGAMEGIISIQQQLLLMERMQSGHSKPSEDKIKNSIETSNIALNRLQKSELLPQALVADLSQNVSRYQQVQSQLIEQFERYEQAQQALASSTETLVAYGEEVEEHGDAAVEELRRNPDQLVSWNTGLERRWSAADGGMESNIGLLRQLYFIEQIKQKGIDEKRLQMLEDAIRFQRDAAEEMIATGLFLQPHEPGSDISMGAHYAQLLENQQQNIRNLLTHIESYRATLRQYETATQKLVNVLDNVESSAGEQVTSQLHQIENQTQAAGFRLLMILIISLVAFAIIAIYGRVAIIRIMHTIAANLQQVASGDGDLSRRLQYDARDELGAIARHFNSFTEKVASIVRSVQKRVEVVNQSMDESVKLFNAIADRAENTASLNTNLANAVEEMQTSSDAIAHSCSLVAKETTTTRDLIRQGQSQVQDTIRDISAMVNVLQTSSESVQALREQAQTIDKIVTVICDISEQTNLLALNAAIEAARAGDQGRGFAVVADEVRNLANRTSESSLEISRVISSIQTETNVSAKNMAEAVSSAQQSVETSQQAGQVLSDIIQHIGNVNEQIHQVASAAHQQSSTLLHISQQVNQVADQAGENNSDAKRCLGVNAHLTENIASLSKTLATFKLN